MKAAGYEPEDYENDVVEVWPENWPVWRFYLTLHTQWRAGWNGKYALDLTPFILAMQRMGLSDDEWDDWMADLRVIEASALKGMSNGG